MTRLEFENFTLSTLAAAQVGLKAYLWGTIPQNVAHPHVTLFVVSDSAFNASDEEVVSIMRVQVDVWHPTSQASLEELYELVRNKLLEAGFARLVAGHPNPDGPFWRIRSEWSYTRPVR
ncbi:MAG: tail completion protein gp17 [Deinococcota bacterium]